MSNSVSNKTIYGDPASSVLNMGNDNPSGTFNSSDIQNCYDSYWMTPTIYRTYTNYGCHHPVEDKGLKALRIIKILIERKLIKLNTVDQFIEMMDELVKVL